MERARLHLPDDIRPGGRDLFLTPNTMKYLYHNLAGCRFLHSFILAAALGKTVQAQGPVGHFDHLVSVQVSGAEIIAANPAGTLLAYTDAGGEQVGFLNIANPAAPAAVASIAVAGEPTSVAITPNGRWALAVVHGTPDHLAIFDLNNLALPPVIKNLGGQPDSIAISPDGRYAAIAIENERDESLNAGLMPQMPAGFLTIVDLVGAPAAWGLRDVGLTGIANRFPSDPEPEFVDINASNEVAVTLQENNHIAIVNLVNGAIIRHFPAGTVTHAADLHNDGQISFTDTLTNARREPDAIGWTPNGRLFTANEGDYAVDGAPIGGRGFTLFSATGAVEFDCGAAMEMELAAAGLYDDTRSGGKGSEAEGIEIGEYHNHTFLFVGMERGSAVAVYQLNGGKDKTKFIQILETGSRPEGLLAIPARGLFVTANEGDGTIDIFKGAPGSP